MKIVPRSPFLGSGTPGLAAAEVEATALATEALDDEGVEDEEGPEEMTTDEEEAEDEEALDIIAAARGLLACSLLEEELETARGEGPWEEEAVDLLAEVEQSPNMLGVEEEATTEEDPEGEEVEED